MVYRPGASAPRIAGGVIAASVAAGPIFLLATLIAEATFDRTLWGGIDQALSTMAILSLFSVPFGFVFSFVPNLVGAWALSRLGCGNDAVRLPVVWALVGGVAAGLFAWAVNSDEADAGLIATFAVTGAACALICRRPVRWE